MLSMGTDPAPSTETKVGGDSDMDLKKVAKKPVRARRTRVR
jgi:hypothetical protein